MNKNSNKTVDANPEMEPENKIVGFQKRPAEIQPAAGKPGLKDYSNSHNVVGISDFKGKRQKCLRLGTNKDIEVAVLSIDVLNDDILREIFSYLSLSDLFRLERVSERWRRVIETVYRKFKKIKIDSNLFWLQREEFVRVGEYLTELEFTSYGKWTDYNEIFNVVNKHCKNLTHLKVILCAEKPNDLNSLSKHIARNLKSFHVENDGTVCDGALSLILKKTVNLEEFVLKAWHLKGSSLSKLPKTVKALSISYHVQDKFLLPVLEKLRSLENLYICCLIGSIPSSVLSNQLVSLIIEDAGCFDWDRLPQDGKLLFPNLKTFKVSKCHISRTTLQNLTAQCPLIEDLALCDFNSNDYGDFNDINDKDFLFLENLQHLRHLDLSGTKIGDETLLHLTIMSNKLQTIRCNGCENITQEGLLQLIDASPKLECLKIGPAEKIESSFFQMALKSVNERPNCNFLTVEISSGSSRYCDFYYALKQAKRLNLELKKGRDFFTVNLDNLNIKFCEANPFPFEYVSKFID